MAPVLVHGDICENQLMVDDKMHVTGIIDWARPGVGHPLVDFDFRQWGFGIFAHKSRFGEFRRTFWTAYAEARDMEAPEWVDINVAYALMEATYFATREKAGKLDEWGKVRRRQSLVALPRATDAVDRRAVS